VSHAATCCCRDCDFRPEYARQLEALTVRRLPSGYWHVRGLGLCNWAQPPVWPCDEETLRAHTFHEAAESFIRAALIQAGEPS